MTEIDDDSSQATSWSRWRGEAIEESSAESMAYGRDYRYVTPRTVSDNNTGETGRAQRNAAHTSDLRR